ncbi:esterase [Aquabacterium sp. OR-4]|uniref:esterase n=1 Tax=Aquabacterium sp. OR-4 TaxID=2978127 RepID=UPI0021B45E91|nr:esterase [Aquabacterium sp. OR-4]MDT7838561.1 esterase [Aquabacterium sp. OR-4]
MNDIVIQTPRDAAPSSQQLLLFFHGVGSSAEDLSGLGQVIAQRHPQAHVVSVRSPDASDLGQGWQWFSVLGVTAENRAQRVAAALPRFQQAVRDWQQRTGVPVERTTLLGFSQGAIMALASAVVAQPLAARVVAMAGRFAAQPAAPDLSTHFHLLHGQADGVVPAQSSIDAQAWLSAAGAPVTLDLFPGLGHGIDGRMLARVQEILAADAGMI